MGCVVCGAETKGAAILCGKCFGEIDDPLSLLPAALDPKSDQRLFQIGSVSLRIGPVSSADISFSKGLEPALRLREILASEDKVGLPQFVDYYLAGLGVGLYLRGDERLPRRGIIWNIMQSAKDLDFKTEQWAAASVRMGNIYALLVREVSRLSIEASAALPFLQKSSDLARTLYARSLPYSSPNRAVSANEALLDHWTGNSEKALSTVEGLVGSEKSESIKAHLLIVKATILAETGMKPQAVQVLESIPGKVRDERVARLKALIGVTR